MKNVIAVILITVCISSLSAGGGGFGSFYISNGMPDVDNLNNTFKNKNYPTVNDNTLMFGGIGFALINHLLIGGEGYSGFASSETDSMRIEYSMGGGFFDIGYVIPVVRAVNVYPIIGIGANYNTIAFRPRLGDVTFDEFLDSPRRTSQINASSFGLNLSLAVHLVEVFKGAPFAGIFLRGGYIYSPFKADWKFEDNAELLGGPELNMSYPYVTFGITFGGRSSDEE